MSVRYGRYCVLRVLGRGASGEVLLAHDAELDREVALKVLHRATPESEGDATRRFLREARLYARVEHPALLPVLAADLEAAPPYLVFPFLPGGTLAEEADRGPAAPDRVSHVGRRLAAALHSLHEAGALHRDVKPANVLLDAHGEPFLADLGMGRSEEDEALTGTGMVVGTPLFMAPEVLEAGSYSQASDLYALGATLLQLALGRPLGSPGALAQEADEVPDRALRALLRKLLRAMPDARPRSGAEVAAEFASLRPTPRSQAAEPREDEATRTRALPHCALPPGEPPPRVPEVPVSMGRVLLRLAALLAAGELIGRALFAGLG